MKTTTKMIVGAAALVLFSSAVAGVTTYSLMDKQQVSESFTDIFTPNPQAKLASLSADVAAAQPVDLTRAAEISVHAVVHIKNRVVKHDLQPLFPESIGKFLYYIASERTRPHTVVRRQIDSTFRTFISSLSIGLFFFMARLNGT